MRLQITSLLFIFLFITSAKSNAQQAKVVNAFNSLDYYRDYMNSKQFENAYKELQKAKDYIELAISNDDTKGKSKTWFYRGNIYHAIYQTTDSKCKGIDTDALVKAFDSYKKTVELDIKKQHEPDLSLQLKNTRIEFTNEAITSYNAKQYELALNRSKYAIEASLMPQVNLLDTVVYFIAGQSSIFLKNYEGAISYFEKLISLKYDLENTYQGLAEIKLAQNDTIGFLNTLQEARKNFPENTTLMKRETDAYISLGMVSQAIENLNLLITKDHNNYLLYTQLGILYQNMQETQNDKIEAAYKKALEINPNIFEANFNLGALYFNLGGKFNNDANDLPGRDNPKEPELRKKADEMFKLSRPYIEKSLEITESELLKDSNNSDLLRNKKDALTSLKFLYYHLGEETKQKEVSDKLQNL